MMFGEMFFLIEILLFLVYILSTPLSECCTSHPLFSTVVVPLSIRYPPFIPFSRVFSHPDPHNALSHPRVHQPAVLPPSTYHELCFMCSAGIPSSLCPHIRNIMSPWCMRENSMLLGVSRQLLPPRIEMVRSSSMPVSR